MTDCTNCPERIHGIFCDLEPPHAEELNQHKTTNHYKRGQKLFHEGSSPTGLFCIFSGKIKLWKSGSEGNEIIIRLFKKSDVVGYRSILTGEPYSATAEAIEDSTVCFIDRHAFTQMISKEPDLAFKMLHRLGHELAEAQDRIRDLSNKDVRQRLGETLLALAKVHGQDTTEGRLLDVRLSRSDLASMVNATPETVIRTLSDFKKQGFLHLDGKQITVSNVNGLAEDIDLQP